MVTLDYWHVTTFSFLFDSKSSGTCHPATQYSPINRDATAKVAEMMQGYSSAMGHEPPGRQSVMGLVSCLKTGPSALIPTYIDPRSAIDFIDIACPVHDNVSEQKARVCKPSAIHNQECREQPPRQ